MCQRFEVERKIDNFIVVYKMKRKSINEQGCEESLDATNNEILFYNTIIIIVTYLYIPIIRDSINYVFFEINFRY